ncbi:MAG: hypothetical protein KDA27_05980 [Candidatus Eisenbacteria bacterium]|uniref:Outer membrane protein beta-barrel domain-containing protein n=1 Tax=Eiseniibacteriota bacterium TaxID=2212470 RepID=A0A956SEI2_UNCEI|nr:hypothetical protein [Candidatus Eisenbacteria bacterium]
MSTNGMRLSALALTIIASSFGPGDVLAAPLLPIHVDLSALAGATRPDPHFADYQWSVDDQSNLGAQLLVGRGRLGVGARGWTTTNVQSVEIPGVLSLDLDTRMVAAEAVLRFDLVQVAGWSLYGQGSGGWMRLSYGTEALQFVPSGSQEEIDVPLDPVDGWIGSAGVGTQYRLPIGVFVGALVDHHVFQMETAHRDGDLIVFQDESFGEWTARAELGWSF